MKTCSFNWFSWFADYFLYTSDAVFDFTSGNGEMINFMAKTIEAVNI